jgi:hypothetical protein
MCLILSHDELFAFAEQKRERYEDLLSADGFFRNRSAARHKKRG